MFTIKSYTDNLDEWTFKLDYDIDPFIIFTHRYDQSEDEDELPFKFFYNNNEMEEENCCILFSKDTFNKYPIYQQVNPDIIPLFIEYLKSLGFIEQ